MKSNKEDKDIKNKDIKNIHNRFVGLGKTQSNLSALDYAKLKII